MKNQRGVTLIALVITIIVLLILAGVSIAMLTGDNGLLTRARDAEDSTAIAVVMDKVNMAIQTAYIDHVKDGTTGEMGIDKVVKAYVADNGASSMTDPTTGNMIVIVSDDGVSYRVTLTRTDESFTIASQSDIVANKTTETDS